MQVRTFMLLLAGALSCATLHAATPEWVTPELQRYIAAVKQADTIADPLQRCLAFPDMPGNQWPAGQQEQQCRYYKTPHLTPVQIGQMLEAGRGKQVEAKLVAELERHMPNQGGDEVIHTVLDEFMDESDVVQEVSARWLRSSPRSAFALAARATYLANMAFLARGTESAAKTPAENFAAMRARARESIALAEQALKINPRLLPAHVRLIQMAMLTGDATLAATAYQRATAVDPACFEAAMARFESLAEKWGGSDAEVLALAARLEPMMAQRPMLAMALAGVSNFYLSDCCKHQAALPRHKETFRRTGAGMLIKRIVEIMQAAPRPDKAELLTYMLAQSRYSNSAPRTIAIRARLLAQAGEPEWALEVVQRAYKLDPSDAFVTLIAEQLYFDRGDFEGALPLLHKTRLLSEPAPRHQILGKLGMIFARERKPLPAAAYLNTLIRETPADGESWFYYGHGFHEMGDRVQATRGFEQFLRLARRDDPSLTSKIALAETALRGELPMPPQARP